MIPRIVALSLLLLLLGAPISSAAACLAQNPKIKVHVYLLCSDKPPQVKPGEKLADIFKNGKPEKINATESCVPFYAFGWISKKFAEIMIEQVNLAFPDQCFELASYSAKNNSRTHTWIKFDENDLRVKRETPAVGWNELRIFVVAHILDKDGSSPNGYSSAAAMQGCPDSLEARKANPTRCERALDGITITAERFDYAVRHEIGHWLGLYHIFENSCGKGKKGDRVADTPGEIEAETRKRLKEHPADCPDPKDILTCKTDEETAVKDNKDAPALVGNTMNYSPCRGFANFTAGQLQRAKSRFSIRQELKPEDMPPSEN